MAFGKVDKTGIIQKELRTKGIEKSREEIYYQIEQKDPKEAQKLIRGYYNRNKLIPADDDWNGVCPKCKTKCIGKDETE